MARVLPMFPLGSVLLPHGLLRLHVFEPRYRALTEFCLAGDGEFGVVLIERGSEVGGGDVRFDVGTVAKILGVGQLDDGRYGVAAVGMQRLRVREWLPEEPYPRAEVDVLDDEPGADGATRVPEVERLLRRVLALRAELGEPVPPGDVELDVDDPVLASFAAALLWPVSAIDAQRLLELDDAGERLDRLGKLLSEEAAVLELRLAER